MSIFLVSGGLGDAVMALGKLHTLGLHHQLIHVHRSDLLTQELQEFYRAQGVNCNVIVEDFDWIKTNRHRYDLELPSTWYGEPTLTPFPPLRYTPTTADIVLTPFAGQRRDRRLNTADLGHFLDCCNRKITIIGKGEFSHPNADNRINQTTLSEAIDLICSAKTVIAPEGFVAYFAGLAGKQVFIHNFNLVAIRERVHPEWSVTLFDSLGELL